MTGQAHMESLVLLPLRLTVADTYGDTYEEIKHNYTVAVSVFSFVLLGTMQHLHLSSSLLLSSILELMQLS
jgi:hypothetical protein